MNNKNNYLLIKNAHDKSKNEIHDLIKKHPNVDSYQENEINKIWLINFFFDFKVASALKEELDIQLFGWNREQQIVEFKIRADYDICKKINQYVEENNKMNKIE